MQALVVDDSRAIRRIVGRVLKEVGFSVVEAENGKLALEALRAGGEFHVALVDWNMPVMNGYEFVCEVRKDHAYAGMPIMMVTTETEVNNVVRALEAGANEYLMKPFTKEMIVQKLELLGFSE